MLRTPIQYLLVEYFAKVQKGDDPRNRMNNLIRLLPDILKLRDWIYRDMIHIYNWMGGKWGLLLGVKNDQEVYLPYIDEFSSYEIPKAFIYPVLAAFRWVVIRNTQTNDLEWEWDIEKFYTEIREKLVTTLISYAKKIRNSTALGKDATTWQSCLQEVLVYRGYKKTQELQAELDSMMEMLKSKN
jgi:hypothetical protein